MGKFDLGDRAKSCPLDIWRVDIAHQERHRLKCDQIMPSTLLHFQIVHGKKALRGVNRIFVGWISTAMLTTVGNVAELTSISRP